MIFIKVYADTTPPVITLIGDASVTVEVGNTYVENGATAVDNFDGDLTNSVVVTGIVNTNVVGTYIVTYSVTDLAGNTAYSITRSVTVSAPADTGATSNPTFTINGDLLVAGSVGISGTDDLLQYIKDNCVLKDENGDVHITGDLTVDGSTNVN